MLYDKIAILRKRNVQTIRKNINDELAIVHGLMTCVV